MLTRLKQYILSSPNINGDLNLCHVFRPLYITLTLFGLFPFSIEFRNNKYFVLIRKSLYLNALCAVSIILIMCTFLVLHIQYLYISLEDNSLTDAIMTQMNYIVELFGLMLVCVITYISFYIKRYNFIKVLNIVAKNFDPPNDFCDAVLKNLRMKINILVGSLVLVLIMHIIINFTRQDSFWKMILVMFTFILPQMVQFLVIVFYSVLVSMVVTLLVFIKHHILCFTKDKKLKNFVKVASRPTMSLQQMEGIYVKAFEVKREVNSAFQATMLVTCMQCFHAMVSESHIIYHGAMVHGNMTAHEIINCSVWILYQVIKIYLLSDAGNLLKVQIAEVGQALHNIPLEKHNMWLMTEIQHFSTLMSFQGNDLSVYGFFLLDGTLMFKIMTSAAMYLIILVQFDKRN